MCATALQIAVGPGPHCKKVLRQTRLRAPAFVLLQHKPWLLAYAYVIAMLPFQMQSPDMDPKPWGIGGILGIAFASARTGAAEGAEAQGFCQTRQLQRRKPSTRGNLSDDPSRVIVDAWTNVASFVCATTYVHEGKQG